jgi:regulator of CtrA degradation
MHIIAWLLTQRAVAAGEISAAEAREPERRLGEGRRAIRRSPAPFPDAARALIRASQDLYERVQRLDRLGGEPAAPYSPARTLMSRLERSF